MGYCRPFKRGVSWRSQNFADNPNNGTNGAGGHTGNDDAAPIGSEVHAAGDGVIEYAGQFDDTYADNLLWLIDFGGDILVLNCGDNEPTFVYAHLSRFLVKPGDRVRKGQVIALSGNSGTRTTGPHCHNEAIAPGYVLNSPTLGRVNPDLYLTEWPDDVGTIAPQGTITPLDQEDDDMASADVNKKLDDIWAAADTGSKEATNAKVAAREAVAIATAARNEATNAKLAARDSVAVAAQIQGLVGAIAALSKGEPFDQAKLLAGVQAAAEAGVKAGIKDGTVSVEVNVAGGK